MICVWFETNWQLGGKPLTLGETPSSRMGWLVQPEKSHAVSHQGIIKPETSKSFACQTIHLGIPRRLSCRSSPKHILWKIARSRCSNFFSACFQKVQDSTLFQGYSKKTWLSRKVLGALSKSPLSALVDSAWKPVITQWFDLKTWLLGIPWFSNIPMPSIKNRPFCCCGRFRLPSGYD